MRDSDLFSSLNQVQPAEYGNTICQEEKPEQQLELATINCQDKTPETPEVKIYQEIAEESGCNTYQPDTCTNSEEQVEALEQQDIPEESGCNTYQPDTCTSSEEQEEALEQQEIPEESGCNTYQPDTCTNSEEQVEALEQQEIPEESGCNTCQPDTCTSSEEQEEALEQQEIPEESGCNTYQPDTCTNSEEQVEALEQQEIPEESGCNTYQPDTCTSSEEQEEALEQQEIPEESGCNTCQPDTCTSSEEQEEALEQQEIPEESGCNTYQPDTCTSSEEQKEALEQQEIPEESGCNTYQPDKCNSSEEQEEALEQQEIPEESGFNTCQPDTCTNSEEQEEALEQQDIPEESGCNTCQPDTCTSSEEQVEALEQQANQHPLEKKYPKPRTYVQALEPIGEDNYGVIYNGWHRKQQKDVAITIIKDPKKQEEILKQIGNLERTSRHGKIDCFYEAYYHPASKKMPHYEGLWVSTELYTGTSLKELINSQKQKSLPENTKAYICKEVLQGLSHLDKNKVIHHDLRPGNIMVASSGDVKIIDFTSATMGLRSRATSGAIPYMAPEVMANIGNNTVDYTTKADVWSLGISVLEMAEGYHPFSRFPEDKIMKRIKHGPAPTLLWDKWSDKFSFFISECLQKNPARRPSAEQLLSHPFICNISNERGVKKSIKRHLQKSTQPFLIMFLLVELIQGIREDEVVFLFLLDKELLCEMRRS
ncbi:serine/threonine-protein kinase pakB [Xenopus laevis]|uniref:Serine/threonine-protein kinase pakB n=1 Tax=Xenopus laevis TaxID=8355 RepID=A0A8J1MG38_XENLA|nr:serine/threonine-protein kinase pakB [Xenopus laevis]